MAELRFERQGATAVLTLDDPKTRNAIGAEIRSQLGEAVHTVRDDASIRAVVITGAGDHFCSGGDLRNIAAAGLDNAGWRLRMQGLHRILRDLLALDKPVICAVDGAAYGAGMGLALAGDFVLMTPRTRMAVSFLKVGLVPDFGLFYLLPRIVGAQRARELMLSTREVQGEEALRLGLAMELHDSPQLLPRALELAESFAGASPMAVSLIKRATAADSNLTAALNLEADAQALAMGSPEHREAVQGFLHKRPPAFSWPAKP